MGTDTKNNLVANSSGIVIGDGRHKPRHYKLHLKLASIFLLCIVVLAGVTAGVYELLIHRSGNSPKSTTANTSVSDQKQSEPANFSSFTPDQKANYYILNNNYQAAQNIYKQELKTANTASEKSGLYISMASVALDARNYSEALDYGKQADSLTPTYYTAKLIAYIYQQQGNKSSAAQYYQLAINRLTKANLPNSDRALNELKADLAGLQS